jgi:hypothetical protein
MFWMDWQRKQTFRADGKYNILHRQRSIRHWALFKVRFAVFIISLFCYLTLLGQGLFVAQIFKFNQCTMSGNFDEMINENLILNQNISNGIIRLLPCYAYLTIAVYWCTRNW